MFVHPSDPMPSVISFGPTQGCTDLVLLDESLSVIPKTEDGATGIVAFITRWSATHYLGNEEASRHMFRSWNGDDILLYTDDIGRMQVDGTIVICGRSSRNVKISGLFVDLDYVERALAPAFADKSLSVTSFKLVRSSATEKIVLFASTQTTDALLILKHARNCLRVSLNDDLAMVISSVHCIPEMPFNASYKIDLAKLQKMADSAESLAPGISAELPTIDSSASKVGAVAERIATEIAKLSKSSETIPTSMPLLYSGLNSITVVRLYMWLQSEYEYEEEMTHLFEEEVTAKALASEILNEVTNESDVDILAEEIAAEVTRLSKSPEAVSKDTSLLYSGLNSITMVQLHMWLQSEHEYEEKMAHLFDEEVTAEVLAKEILGRDNDGESDAEESGTESSTDTIVEDGASEVHVLEKDLYFTSEDFVSETDLQVSDELTGDSTTNDDNDVPHTSVVGPPDDGIPDTYDENTAFQILIVNESDSDHEGDGVENEDEVPSYRQPKSPLLNLMSPLLCAFPFNDLPKSPSLDNSPFSYMFSSWITPSLLDSVL